MPLGIRGANPIWSEVDLQGNLFDDTFYLFVLQNTIPYVPAIVYHDPDLNVPWTNPIQFLGNGTLPVDIFFESEVFYRLEFRQGPTQSDPLVYEVNNYTAGAGGSTPVDTIAFASSNQITNPQFSIINFTSPFSLVNATDPDPIDVAPGWFLELAGTGSATLTQVPLNDDNANPSNAPYALRLTLTGWNTDGVFLRQRFEQNGMLWANKIVSSTITTRVEGSPQVISANLVDSNDSTLTQVLDLSTINEDFNEFTGYGELNATTNPDLPPVAFIDYKLAIPNNVDIYVTSFQLVVQELPLEPGFEQDSIDRQIDHTFHYYKPLLEFKPVTSLLTGWDFPLNPAQPHGPTYTIVPSSSTPTDEECYIWDQTISNSLIGNIDVVRNTVTGGFEATTTSANEAFYLIQYLNGNQAKKILDTQLSVNINAFRTEVGGDVTCSIYLYSARSGAVFPTLPIMIGTVDALGVFTLTAANWTEIPRVNNQLASSLLSEVDTGDYTTLNAVQDLKFSGWEITSESEIADTDKFAIVVTFSCPTLGSVIVVDSISLIPGGIPTRPAPQTINQVLSDCQYYYQKSFLYGVAPAQNLGANTGESVSFQGTNAGTAGTFGPIIRFPIPMITTPNIVLYNISAANSEIRSLSIAADWSASSATIINENGFTSIGTTPGGTSVGNGCAVNWTADARLGIV